MIYKHLAAIPMILLCLTILSACSLALPPQRFPQFSEVSIAGPGSFWLPQWSNDGRYLAYIDDTNYKMGLVVYDTQNKSHWNVASFVSQVYFDWTPDDRLSYLAYRADLSGAPWPEIFDLHVVDRDGQNDHIIASSLYSPKNFAWFGDGIRMAILITQSDTQTGEGDIYILNTSTGEKALLMTRQQLDITYPAAITLSSDEKLLLINGIISDSVQDSPYIVLDLATQRVVNKIVTGKIIPTTNTAEIRPGALIYSNWGWVGGNRWILTNILAPDGECYNYALFFIDTQDPNNSFCIPTSKGPIAAPTISPDLSQIAYITVEGPGNYYVMIGELPADIQAKLMGQKE